MNLIKQSHSVIIESDPYRLIELAGRTCYKSEDKITPESSTKFVKMLTKQGHLSVLEHVSIIFQVPSSVLSILYDIQRNWDSSKIKYLNVSNENVPVVSGNMRAWLELLDQPDLPCNPHLKAIGHYLGYRFPEIFKAEEKSSARVTILAENDLTDVEQNIHCTRTVRLITNRSVTHELVRHRPCAFSQESTRFVKYDKVEYIIPVWEDLRAKAYNSAEVYDQADTLEELFIKSCYATSIRYRQFLALGWRPEQAREILPNSLKTEIVMTATLSEWKHIFKLRCSDKAHPQMKALMRPLSIDPRIK